MDRDTKEVQASACIREQKFRDIQLYEFIPLTCLETLGLFLSGVA